MIFEIGNLTKEPEKIAGVDKTLCKLTIAVNGKYTKADGSRPVEFFNVAVWGALGDNCINYLHKGSKIAVIGNIQTRSWEDNGEKKYTFEIVAKEIEFLGSPASKESKETATQEIMPIQDGDLPF